MGQWNIRVDEQKVATVSGRTVTDAVLAYYRSLGHPCETLEDIFLWGFGPVKAEPVFDLEPSS